MSEDEAFIRAIVDSPGDDTPRLVYADWLDDRSDPRGAYLRAELEWAQPWKADHPPGWGPRERGRGLPQWGDDYWEGLDEMMAAAVGLDPVWVARVSRPPAGVCCDHVRFTKFAPPPAATDVARVETSYGRPLASEHRAFLLNYNGGRPDLRQLIVRGGDEGSWDRLTVQSFAWVRTAGRELASEDESVEALRDLLDYLEAECDGFEVPDVATRYVPVGQVHSNGVLLMKADVVPSREIYVLWTEDWGKPEPLTRSLPELLARITTDPI